MAQVTIKAQDPHHLLVCSERDEETIDCDVICGINEEYGVHSFDRGSWFFVGFECPVCGLAIKVENPYPPVDKP